MKKIKKIGACLLVGTMMVSSLGICPLESKTAVGAQNETYEVNGEKWKYGIGDAIGFNEDTYKSIDPGTTSNNWRDGSVTANGEIGFIESCDPKEDVFIFNNTKIVTDGDDIFETPVISRILDDQRVGAVTRKKFPWITEVGKYAREQYGTDWGITWPRKYQPAAQYRIKNNSFSEENTKTYNRYTNYETGEVGAQWKDAEGNEWNRRSFASREDDVIVTYIEAPEGQELDLTLSVDNMVEMRTMETVYYRPKSDNVVTKDNNGYAFGMVGKYAIRNRKGTKNIQETKFAHGGWGTATRIITEGTVDYKANKRDITVPSGFGGGTINDANDPQFTIKGTNSVMLVTKVDRIDSGCDTTDDVKTKLFDKLVSEIDATSEKYSLASKEESYQKILKPHVDIHGGMFNNVRINLCSTPEDIADRSLTNTKLIKKQNSNKKVINKAFLERIYNNGRFGLICASGYGSTRLGAIWNGAWMPEWSGDFTLDANTNLQVSGMNTGNMPGASEGYVNFIIRMVEDWDDDAANVYGMKDAIKAPPRVDGTGESGSYHFIEGYPHIYVNGITDWLILPMFEYWQCYGNQKIKVGKDVDIDRNKEVLDLSDEDVERIKKSGHMDLEKDILMPMLKKTMNFWLQYVDERFYTDGNGVEHANDGTTISSAIAAGDKNCKYLFTPGYSPENTPKGGGENSRYALAYNTTMDISASRDTLFMARTIMEAVNPGDKESYYEKWNDFESKIPEYLYDETTGAIKEWASPKLQDYHKHRHVSHAYVAWPAYESQTSDKIRDGVIKAMDCRSKAYNGKEASESHGPTHKALVEARLKNVDGFQNVLKYLLTNNYQYSSMMTSHNNNHQSTYCTDSAFGIMGAVNESLLYSNTGVIEILPTLLDSSEKGNITGLRARCNTQCDIAWDEVAGKASVQLTSDEDNNKVKVSCGLLWNSATVNGTKQEIKKDENGKSYVEVVLKKGEKAEVDFATTTKDSKVSILAKTDSEKVVEAGTTVDLKAMATFGEEEKDVSAQIAWNVVDATTDGALENLSIIKGKLEVKDNIKGKTLKISAKDRLRQSNEIILHVSSGEENSVDVNTKTTDNEITTMIGNDNHARTLLMIQASYNKTTGKMTGFEEKEVPIKANEFMQITTPVKEGDGTTTKQMIWDKETLIPYTE